MGKGNRATCAADEVGRRLLRSGEPVAHRYQEPGRAAAHAGGPTAGRRLDDGNHLRGRGGVTGAHAPVQQLMITEPMLTATSERRIAGAKSPGMPVTSTNSTL